MSATPLRWRAVYFVQRLITRLAPPLHSLHWKILALLLVAIFLPALYFLWQVRWGIEWSHLRSTEQGMIDTAVVVAESLHGDPASGSTLQNLPTTREIKRRVFGDLSPQLRLVIYDATGKVLSDTDGAFPPGLDRARERDVQKALQGSYGARWLRDDDRRIVQLIGTVPVYAGGAIVGAVSVIKPTSDVRRSIVRSLQDLALPALIALFMAMLTSYLLSTYLTGVITGLARRADRVAAGEADVQLETWTKSELGDLARAVEKMRRKLEGKAYVEEMVTTFSHELKTPLSAIRGASEIAEEAADPTVRARFLQMIRAEVDRLTSLVANLLALSRIETGPLERGTCCLTDLAATLTPIYSTRAQALGLSFAAEITPSSVLVAVPVDAVHQILDILIENALQFSPKTKTVTLRVDTHSCRVTDQGAGIEAPLQARIFDRFVTTINPLTGRRGTGLGLAIARSLVERHHASLNVESTPGKGATFVAIFPETS